MNISDVNYELRKLQDDYQFKASILLYERDSLLKQTPCILPFFTGKPKTSYRLNPQKYFAEIYDSPPPANFQPTIIYGEHPKTYIYGFPKDTYINTMAKSNSLNPPLFHLLDDEYYIEVVRFSLNDEGFCELYIPFPVGTYYYPVSGSGVYHPIGKRPLIAHNKAHALHLLGFDFTPLIKSYFGKLPLHRLDEAPTTPNIFDPRYTYEVSSYIRWSHQGNAFPDIINNFKTKNSLSGDTLSQWLATINNPEDPKYPSIYSGSSAHFLWDPLLYRLARNRYTSILLTHEPTSFESKQTMEYIDLTPTYRRSISRLKKASLFKPSSLPNTTDISGINHLQSILDNEELSEEKKLTNNVIIHKLTTALPGGYLIGSYAYGFQTIHTDIDYVYPLGKSIESIKNILTSIGFNYSHTKDNTIVLYFDNIMVEVAVLKEQDPMNKLFSHELSIYSVLKRHPELCKAIRLLNQLSFNRQFQGPDYGYIHSTFFYALCIEWLNNNLDNLDNLDNSYIDIFESIISTYSAKPIDYYSSILKKYDIKITTTNGIKLLRKEFIRANKYLSNFNRLFKKITPKSLLKKLPNQVFIKFNTPNEPILRYFNPENTKFRFYRENSTTTIFSDKPITKHYLDLFIRDSKKYEPDLDVVISA